MTVRGLSELSEPFLPIVTRLVAERPDALGLGKDPLSEVLPGRSFYGPYSDVLEIELRTVQAKWRGFVKSGKASRDRSAATSSPGPTQAEFDLLARLWDVFGASPQFGTPRPVAFYSEYSALVTEDVGGRSFSSELRTRANLFVRQEALNQLADTCRRFGQWLLKFQSITAGPVDCLVCLDDKRVYLDQRLAQLVEMRFHGVDSDWRASILDFFDRLAPTVKDEARKTVGIHGDFSLGNLIVSAEQVAVIDFETFSYGSAMYDISHLYHHLYHLRSNPRYRHRVARALTEALLQGYDPEFDTKAPLFRLHQIEHTVCMLLEMSQTPASSLLDAIHRKSIGRQYLRCMDQIMKYGLT